MTHSLNENQIKAFNKLCPLILYDLNKNDVYIDLNYEFFLKFHNKKISFNNVLEKEKIASTLEFYNYILNPSLCNSFLNIYDYIYNKKPWIFSNSFLNCFFETFDNKNISILFYSNIVVKTLSTPSYYRKAFYENDSDEISTVDNWHNSNIVLESQYILINNFIIYNKINLNISDSREKGKYNVTFSNLFKFINTLIKEKIVKEKIVIRTEGNSIKTHKFWSIAEETDLTNLICETNFSLLPYTLVEHFGVLYEKGYHFSKTILIFKKNWYSGEIFNINDKEYINKIINLKFYINKKSLEFIRKTVLNFENMNNIDIKESISHESLTLKTIFNKKKIDANDRFKIKEIQKKINKLIDIERMSRMISNVEDEEVRYLPIFFDFRGRNYFDDYLSPTFSRLTRISFFYGYYTKEEIEKTDISLIKPFLSDEVLNIINKVLIKYEIPNENYSINSVFWLLIGIGKHFIEKSDIKIPLIKFIEEGFFYIENNIIKKLEIKDYIEINHYVNIIENLKYKDKLKKEVILKDATASVLQNLIKILGPKDQKSIDLSNLGDTHNWYDPYSYILKKWKDSFIENNENLLFFKRSTIKKTIMTNPYSAGEEISWIYFKKSVKEEFLLNDSKIDDLKEDFINFYQFVSDFFEELHFFKNSSKKIIKYYTEMAKKEKKIILINEDSQANFIYYKHKTHYIDIKNNSERITKKIKKIDYNKINYNKIHTSIRANIAHWLDAIFLRKLVNKLKNPIFTVHDEFAIDILNVNNLIIYANEIANESIKIDIPWDHSHNFKIFSIFILI